MRNNAPFITPTAGGPRRRAFTLIELLVVISIIALLATLLTPVLNAAKRSIYRAKSAMRLNELSTGAVSYAKDSDQMYPGQMYSTQLLGLGSSGGFTGSQWLAISLFGLRSDQPDNTTNGWSIDNKTKAKRGQDIYAPYNVGNSDDTCDLQMIDLYPTSIWDRYPGTTPLAICYYPARTGSTDLTQFQEGDNSIYTDRHWSGGTPTSPSPNDWYDAVPAAYSPTKGQTNFPSFITDRRLSDSSTTPYRSGAFILIAPGIDRKYGTGDDITNIGQ